jgi:hypothetical protein
MELQGVGSLFRPEALCLCDLHCRSKMTPDPFGAPKAKVKLAA